MNYSWRNASTGSIRLARLAGSIPNTSPIPIETIAATTALQSAPIASPAAASPARPGPARRDADQPADQGEGRRFHQELPEDLLAGGAAGHPEPISRVRSVTETIMMAITPMPPTSSATLEIAVITRKNIEVSWSITSRIWSWVMKSKVLGMLGRRPGSAERDGGLVLGLGHRRCRSAPAPR